jgi:hypothetical protein
LWALTGKSPGIWKCPADQSKVTVSGVTRPRVRSMSMSIWVGGWGTMNGSAVSRTDAGCSGPAWKVYGKFSDLIAPGPAMTWVLVDAREDRINYGNNFTDMLGYPNNPAQARFHWDYPGNYHHRAAGFSFADGHAEIKKWRDDRTVPPIVKDQSLFSGGSEYVPSPRNPDILWMQERSTRLK